MESHPELCPNLCSLVTTKEDEFDLPTLSLGPSSPLEESTTFERSGSNSSGAPPMLPAKRMRTEATTDTSVRFKGVVLQQNGHWGAQIYAHHSRIWLGTFKTERAAARAYDSAAIKLHRGDSHRNFPFTELTAHELSFQEMFPREAVLDMIRDGSYETKFAEYLWLAKLPREGADSHRWKLVPVSTRGIQMPAKAGVAYRELFQKELTPSDVGKLNRLVIPKKFATKCLPEVSEEVVEEVLVDFMDRENRMWAFRYCYWKSSQSYVFTKGWNKFVKEKRLKAKDVVAFYHCEEREGKGREYRMIDILRDIGDDGREVNEGEGEVERVVKKRPLMLFGVRIEDEI